MPTYEYKCLQCGELSEYFQKITDDPKTTCEKCGGDLKKLISGGLGPIFKGTGFYQTDYKNNGNGKAAKKETKTETKKDSTPKTTTKDA